MLNFLLQHIYIYIHIQFVKFIFKIHFYDRIIWSHFSTFEIPNPSKDSQNLRTKHLAHSRAKIRFDKRRPRLTDSFVTPPRSSLHFCRLELAFSLGGLQRQHRRGNWNSAIINPAVVNGGAESLAVEPKDGLSPIALWRRINRAGGDALQPTNSTKGSESSGNGLNQRGETEAGSLGLYIDYLAEGRRGLCFRVLCSFLN